MAERKALDYARYVVSSTDWTQETPLLTHSSWTVHTSPKIDFRIYVVDFDRMMVVMGPQTWAALCCAGMNHMLDFVNTSIIGRPGVHIVPWNDEVLTAGMRALGWAPKDIVGQLIDDANQLLVQAVGVNEASTSKWHSSYAQEYVRIRERRDELAKDLSRIDAMLAVAETTLVDPIAS